VTSSAGCLGHAQKFRIYCNFFLEKWHLFLEIQRIPLVMLLSIGKFQLTGQASCLSLSSSYQCWFVKRLSCVWYRAGGHCVCWQCFLLNRVYIFSTSTKYVMEKMSPNVWPKYVNNAMWKNNIQNRVLSSVSLPDKKKMLELFWLLTWLEIVEWEMYLSFQ